MAGLLPLPKQQFFDNNGNPLVGGKVYTYAAGTATPLASYTSASGGTTNPNPVILDARGEAEIWLSNASYKITLTDYNDVPVYTVDSIIVAEAVAIAGSIATLTAADVAINQALTAEAAARIAGDTAISSRLSGTSQLVFAAENLTSQGQTSSTFVAPFDGLYLFSVEVTIGSTSYTEVNYEKNGVTASQVASVSAPNGLLVGVVSLTSFYEQLATNDQIRFFVQAISPNGTVFLRKFKAIKVR